MDITIEPSWKSVLASEFEAAYFKKLTAQVQEAYSNNQVFPPEEQIFNAFALCPFNRVRVVILGQDPYHGPGQANGLSFSVKDGVSIPPSLINIYKEIESDLGIPAPKSGNLEGWAKQGVLLINATLTVECGQPNSHQNFGWEQFTDAAIRAISDQKEHVVFLLWGKFAQNKASLIDETKHLILKAPHPSPFSAHTGFLGCKHFSKVNDYITSHKGKPIDW